MHGKRILTTKESIPATAGVARPAEKYRQTLTTGVTDAVFVELDVFVL